MKPHYRTRATLLAVMPLTKCLKGAPRYQMGQRILTIKGLLRNGIPKILLSGVSHSLNATIFKVFMRNASHCRVEFGISVFVTFSVILRLRRKVGLMCLSNYRWQHSSPNSRRMNTEPRLKSTQGRSVKLMKGPVNTDM